MSYPIATPLRTGLLGAKDKSRLDNTVQRDGSTAMTGTLTTQNVLPDADSARRLGDATKAWDEVHAKKALVATLQDRTTAKSVDAAYLTNGTAKAWAGFSFTSAAIDGSFNVSSWTDAGVGDGVYSLISALDSTNGVATNTCDRYAPTIAAVQSGAAIESPASVRVVGGGNTADRYDWVRGTSAVHGVLA